VLFPWWTSTSTTAARLMVLPRCRARMATATSLQRQNLRRATERVMESAAEVCGRGKAPSRTRGAVRLPGQLRPLDREPGGGDRPAGHDLNPSATSATTEL
jgi:hypothetical protein